MSGVLTLGVNELASTCQEGLCKRRYQLGAIEQIYELTSVIMASEVRAETLRVVSKSQSSNLNQSSSSSKLLSLVSEL